MTTLHIVLTILAFGCFAIEAWRTKSLVALGLTLLAAALIW